jgi:hypothetical protein
VVKPKPGAPVVVVAPKPAQPAQPAPAGYTEVGQEAENPGLPPIGYETHTGGATGTQPKPIIGTPTQDPGTTYGPKPANPRDQTKKIDTIKDPIVVTGPGVSDPDDVGPSQPDPRRTGSRPSSRRATTTTGCCGP